MKYLMVPDGQIPIVGGPLDGGKSDEWGSFSVILASGHIYRRSETYPERWIYAGREDKCNK